MWAYLKNNLVNGFKQESLQFSCTHFWTQIFESRPQNLVQARIVCVVSDFEVETRGPKTEKKKLSSKHKNPFIGWLIITGTLPNPSIPYSSVFDRWSAWPDFWPDFWPGNTRYCSCSIGRGKYGVQYYRGGAMRDTGALLLRGILSCEYRGGEIQFYISTGTEKTRKIHVLKISCITNPILGQIFYFFLTRLLARCFRQIFGQILRG